MNLLERKPVDRASFFEALWEETIERWCKEGHLHLNEDINTEHWATIQFI